MSYKGTVFNDQEWAALQMSVLWIFQAVAGADGKIDDKEKKSFMKLIDESEKFENQLAKEVFGSLQHEGKRVLEMSEEDLHDMYYGLEYTADLLKERLDPEECVEFKKSVVAMGVYVGRSSGGWFTDKFSDEEQDSLRMAASHFKIALVALLRTNALDKIIEPFLI